MTRSFSDLRLFCEHVVRKFGSVEEVSEERLADEFRKVYLKDLPTDLRTVKAVAASCGFKLDGVEKMPDDMRGYHEQYGDTKTIYFRQGDSLSGIENTILHEIREMMDDIFAEVQPGYVPMKKRVRHGVANRFASAVLLPEGIFRDKVYETGFDVVELSRLYSKSCSQVLLRMGEVLRGRLFMYTALYEPDVENQWRVTYWAGSCNEDDPDANVYDREGFFPRRGRAVSVGSLVEMAIKDTKPHLVNRITFLDELDSDEGLAALARPAVSAGRATRVALVALLSRDRSLFEPQVQRINPIVINSFHRHL